MFKHYLTVAFRNLWKYKTQSVVSILGLAVGFVCFALSMMWIRYEMTYDSFHKKAAQIYTINTPSIFNPHGFARQNPYPLAAYLKETFPEVSNACNINAHEGKIKIEDVRQPVLFAYVDSSFLEMFDIQIIEGNSDFIIQGSGKIAITKEKSKELFQDENPIGKMTGIGSIGAVVTGYSKHSNYPFEILAPKNSDSQWNVSSHETLIELSPGTDAKAFQEKLYNYEIKQEQYTVREIRITPLTTMRYEDPNIRREVEFQHILLFSLSGILVILCSLFNFFTLFICRFRTREKEFALRMVSGASGRSLLSLLLVEFFITLFPALLLSLLLINLTSTPFQKLSNIQMNLSAIYGESILYIGAVVSIALLVFILLLLIFRKRALNVSIKRHRNNLFRKTSVIFQLIISIGFLFCTTIMMKQLYFLHHTDLGFSYQNAASLIIYDPSQSESLETHLKQIPEITETLKALQPIIPVMGQQASSVADWEDKSPDAPQISIEEVHISKSYVEFYEFQLIEGEMLNEDETEKYVLINESAAKAFGWEHPVGKKISSRIVKGLIKNIYSSLPTLPVKPCLYRVHSDSWNGVSCILFKYQEGKWEACKSKIEQLIKEEYANYQSNLFNTEEEYDKFLKSENALLKLLSVVSMVCMIISVFGFFSLISLSCEERRKEIAIRKINGATMRDILKMYFKTYFLLLITGAVIAFPIGHYIMKQWLEQYVKQTSISAWIYITILLVMVFIIVLCVGWRVYKASVENPAEVIKAKG